MKKGDRSLQESKHLIPTPQAAPGPGSQPGVVASHWTLNHFFRADAHKIDPGSRAGVPRRSVLRTGRQMRRRAADGAQLTRASCEIT